MKERKNKLTLSKFRELSGNILSDDCSYLSIDKPSFYMDNIVATLSVSADDFGVSPNPATEEEHEKIIKDAIKDGIIRMIISLILTMVSLVGKEQAVDNIKIALDYCELNL